VSLPKGGGAIHGIGEKLSADLVTGTGSFTVPITLAQESTHQFLDLAGDGLLDCVLLEHPLAGFFKRTEDGGWEPFRSLSFVPVLDWQDRNLQFIDIDEDGHVDILLTENDALCWYPSLAEDGFGDARKVPKNRDEEHGPTIMFADSTQSVLLADMSGDGLSDIVHIRNGEVAYWPNLGYGCFGAKVAMDQSPFFELPELFDTRHIRLADIDGSGVSDLIYLRRDGVHVYFNQAGNSWTQSQHISAAPPLNSLESIQALDILGNGTSCLIWSSSLPTDTRRSLRYIDFMGGEKPHLIVRMRNNLGAETRICYAPSTTFYLQDLEAGQPWVTRLPFPVHVLQRVETYDWVSRNRFFTRYAYNHGYYDGIEREFRGFGRVDQWDTEDLGSIQATGEFPTGTNFDVTSDTPPLLTKTWLHTGAFIEGGRITKQFDHEYYYEETDTSGASGLTDQQLAAMLIPDTVLPRCF
jgi:hypothetical protein